MSHSNSVNGAITDAVTQANVKVLAEAPTVAVVNSILAMSQGFGILTANMVADQAKMQMTYLASATQGLNSLKDVTGNLAQLSAKVDDLGNDLRQRVEDFGKRIENISKSEGNKTTNHYPKGM